GTEASSTDLATLEQADDCSDMSGTALDLGVVDSNNIATTAVNSTTVDNDGLAMVRTNAISGAVIYYKAEQETASGQLKIATEACNGTNLDDPCFNSVGTTRSAIVAGTEEFGLALKELTN